MNKFAQLALAICVASMATTTLYARDKAPKDKKGSGKAVVVQGGCSSLTYRYKLESDNVTPNKQYCCYNGSANYGAWTRDAPDCNGAGLYQNKCGPSTGWSYSNVSMNDAIAKYESGAIYTDSSSCPP